MVPCSRGCCETQAQHYRSLVLAGSRNPVNTEWDRTLSAYRTAVDNGGDPPTVDSAPEYLKAVGG